MKHIRVSNKQLVHDKLIHLIKKRRGLRESRASWNGRCSKNHDVDTFTSTKLPNVSEECPVFKAVVLDADVPCNC